MKFHTPEFPNLKKTILRLDEIIKGLIFLFENHTKLFAATEAGTVAEVTLTSHFSRDCCLR